MQIFIRSLSGRVITFEFGPEDSVESLKLRVQEAEGIRPVDQRIVYASHHLENGRMLADYSIIAESTLHVSMRLRGGMVDRRPMIEKNPFLHLSNQSMNKLICRKCYATNPPDEKVCRKKKCGHSSQLRVKKNFEDKWGRGYQ